MAEDQAGNTDPAGQTRAVSDDGGVVVVVEGGFVAELRWDAARSDPDTLRRTINDALLAWYERNRQATLDLEAALARAESLASPSPIAPPAIPEPPAWIERAFRVMDELGPENRK